MASRRKGVRSVVVTVAAAMLLASCAGGDEDADPPRAEPTASPTDGATGSPGEALAEGAAPAVDYVQASEVHRADGSTLALQIPLQWGITSAHRFGDGWIVTDDRAIEGTVGMFRLTAEGKRRGSWSSTGPALREIGGDDLAWVSLVPEETGASGPTRIHVEGRSQTLANQFQPVLLRFADGEITYAARVPSSGGRTSLQRFRTDLESEPVAARRGQVRVPSPDGSRWYVRTPQGLALGGAEAEMKVPFARDGAAGLVEHVPAAWEDDESLLVLWVDGDRSTLVRIKADGSLERTLEWSGGTAQEWPVPVG